MSLFHLNDFAQREFAELPEVFPNLQLATWREKRVLVVGTLVVVQIDQTLRSDLSQFFASTWGPRDSELRAPYEVDIVRRYDTWLESLPDISDVSPDFATREELHSLIRSMMAISSPPDRPDLSPYPRRGRPPGISDAYGHLPFATTTTPNDVFYRFEPWPQSRRIDQKNKRIAPQTFAAPQSELPLCPTGFAAVARYALPHLFPSVFRWELQPKDGTKILCGASIPMNSQSGGGVEVCFVNGAQNRGPIANPVIVPAL